MTARMDNPASNIPGLLPALLQAAQSIKTAARSAGLPEGFLHLLSLRTSQINGCAFCVDMHTKDAIAIGEDSQRLNMVAVWREAPGFTPR